MKFEMKRKIDELGRVVLPIDLRNYYGITHGDEVVLLPVRGGIQIAKAEFFIMDQLPKDVTVHVDELGRIIIPSVFRKQYDLEAKDTLCIEPHETCMLIYKSQDSVIAQGE